MYCDLSAVYVCIDVENDFVLAGKTRSSTVDEMPICLGDWMPLPSLVPHGSYGLIHSAEVTKGAPRDAVIKVMVGGRLIAIVHWGEKRNWTCVPGALEKKS